MSEQQNIDDQDAGKGAMECEREDCSNTSMAGQNPHRTESSLVKANDSDFPEPGSSPEHSGQRSAEAHGQSPEREQVDQDPGHRQKKNQNESKDDPLAA